MGKKKILFFTPTLGGGGAEMQLLRLINTLDKSKFECTLVLARAGGDYESFLKKSIDVKYLTSYSSGDSSTQSLIRSIFPLRKLIRKTRPDIVFSIMDHANLTTLVALNNLKNKPKIILCIQNDPVSVYQKNRSFLSKGIIFLMKQYYPKADRIISLSEGVYNAVNNIVNGILGKHVIIHNIGYDKDIIAKAAENLSESFSHPLIVACGRLVEQKGYPYLIEAVKHVLQHRPVDLIILGEGHLEKKLKKKVNNLGLEQHIHFLGFKSNPFKYMAAGDVFVLSSIHEGFGNVIVESMACGTPVIATRCPHGPDEIIQNKLNGLLIPPKDSKAIAGAILELLADKNKQKKLKLAGYQRAKEFSAEKITKKYEDLFLELNTK